MRPRLCLVCKTEATWGEQTIEPVVSVKLDGQVHRGSTVRTTYYCEPHLPSAGPR